MNSDAREAQRWLGRPMPTDHPTVDNLGGADQRDNPDTLDTYAAELMEFWELTAPQPVGSAEQRAA
jgi:hypothetical protein